MPPVRLCLAALLCLPPAALASGQRPGPGFTLEQIKGYPFPTELTAAGRRLAWALDRRGLRNIWVAEGPAFAARQLSDYGADEGQELTSVSISPDGKYVVYVRGGEHSANWPGLPPNPASMPVAPKVQIWSIPYDGGTAKLLAEGDEPAISPRSDVVAFVSNGQVSTVPIDGSTPARRLFTANGTSDDLAWSPDGSRLAFVSSRGDHSFIGIYTGETTPLLWLAPSTSRDGMPRWSPDGKRVAFVRRPGAGGPPEPILAPRVAPWAIWSADATTGAATELWKAPETLRGSIPATQGGPNLRWGAGRIAFLSYQDGWPHLYSIPENGGEALLLTPGSYMAEYIQLSPDGRFLVFTGNAGTDPDDIDRRHIVRVPIDRATPAVLTPGAGLEWTPVVMGDGRIAAIGATAQRPPLPMVLGVGGAGPVTIGADQIPADFPTAQLVIPKKVVYKASDGVEVHAQLFEPSGRTGRRPAVIFVHGGPPRQMLLGWHYSDYYSNTYALNQYLASRGFVVLSVNYRLGIGYGFEFHRPANAGFQGASEYLDVTAAAEWLRGQPDVDPARIGIYGGSYGGYLTALALARNSDLFATGVDIHGVHDWTTARSLLNRERYEEAPDLTRALEVAFASSPVSAVATWKSPVLLIHGDDDRNVRFNQTVDLVRRLAAKGVEFEELVIPDDTHHFLKHSNLVKVDAAAADWLERKLRP